MASNPEWEAWLAGIPQEQQDSLYATLLNLQFDQFNGAVTGRMSCRDPQPSNGPRAEEPRKVRITKTPLEDLMIEHPPPYLDIFHLHDLYKSLAFNTNIIVKGPKGDGKSLSVNTFAHASNSPLIIQECSEDTKKMDLMGTQNLLGDETVFTLGCIPAAIETANEYGRCILCFEELNALTPQVQKMLNAVTDFRKQCSLPFLGKTYTLRPDAYLWVVGLMNPSAYSGTYDLNEDLKSRFEEVDLTYPPAGLEKEVLKTACHHLIGKTIPKGGFRTLVDGQGVNIQYIDDTIITMFIKFAGETRQQATGYALSTRDLVRILENVGRLGVEQTLQLILCKFEGAEDKNTITKRMGAIFGQFTLKHHWT